MSLYFVYKIAPYIWNYTKNPNYTVDFLKIISSFYNKHKVKQLHDNILKITIYPMYHREIKSIIQKCNINFEIV